MVLKTLANTFIGKKDEEVLDGMMKLLFDNGFVETTVPGKKRDDKRCETKFYSKADKKNIFAITVNTKNVQLPVIMPMTLAEQFYMEDGKFNTTIRLKSHSNDDTKFSPAVDYEGKRNVYLHRVLMMQEGIDIKGKQGDHICGHHGVVVIEELRPCTGSENILNRRVSHIRKNCEFDYDKYHDFRDSFWIPFLHYVLGIISYDEMHTLRAMEIEYDKNKANNK